MANHIADLTFQRFGKLVAVHLARKDEFGRWVWTVLCDCGTVTERSSARLIAARKKGAVSHCGCSPHLKTHGLSKSMRKLHDVWNSMKARCYRETSKDFKNYGGRGIVVCDEWRNSFAAFAEWAVGTGYEEGVSTIERVDVNGNYCPENCTWIINERQALNTRKVVMLTHEGRTMALSDWASELGLRPNTIKTRLRLGWPVSDALTTKPGERGFSGAWKQ